MWQAVRASSAASFYLEVCGPAVYVCFHCSTGGAADAVPTLDHPPADRTTLATLPLQDFTCGGDKFQDGAVTANNPAIIALQEAVRAGCRLGGRAGCRQLASVAAHALLVAAAAGGYAPLLCCRSRQRLLWPDHPIDVLMSVGVGVSPAGRRDKGLSSFMETGALGQGAELGARMRMCAWMCMPSSGCRCARSTHACLPLSSLGALPPLLTHAGSILIESA